MAYTAQPIETKRLLLRPFCEDDAPAMYRNWANDPEVCRWLRWEPHQNQQETLDIIRSWVTAYQQENLLVWGITLKENGELIGSIGLLPCSQESSPGHTMYEPGYCIGRRYWGNGYTSEALPAMLDDYISATGNTNLVCTHATGNPASGRVMQKAGFVYHHDGSYTTFNGRVIPSLWYVYRPSR